MWSRRRGGRSRTRFISQRTGKSLKYDYALEKRVFGRMKPFPYCTVKCQFFLYVENPNVRGSQLIADFDLNNLHDSHDNVFMPFQTPRGVLPSQGPGPLQQRPPLSPLARGVVSPRNHEGRTHPVAGKAVSSLQAE